MSRTVFLAASMAALLLATGAAAHGRDENATAPSATGQAADTDADANRLGGDDPRAAKRQLVQAARHVGTGMAKVAGDMADELSLNANETVSTADNGTVSDPGINVRAPEQPGWMQYLAPFLAFLAALILAFFLNRKINKVYDAVYSQFKDHEGRLATLEREGPGNRNTDAPPSPPVPARPAAQEHGQRRQREADEPAQQRPAPPLRPLRPPEPPRRVPDQMQEAAVDKYRALIATPIFSSSEFISALLQYGRVLQVTGTSDGLKLGGPATGGPGELLIAVKFDNGSALLVPSVDFVKEFAMAYKETLDVGPLIPQAFDLEADGSGVLTYRSPALARIAYDGALFVERPGELAGFVR